MDRTSGKVREFKNLIVNFVSLVSRPANKEDLISRHEGPRLFERNVELDACNVHAYVEIDRRTIDRAKRMVYGIVYRPYSVDTEKTWATPETIAEACKRFMEECRTQHADVEHDYNANHDVFVVENWIVKKEGDAFWKTPEYVDSWAMGVHVRSDEIWEKVESGEITGLSLAGKARLGPEQSEKSIGRSVEEPKDTEETVVAKFLRLLKGGGDVERIGKVFSTKNLQSIREAHKALETLLNVAEPSEPETDRSEKEEVMEEVLKMVKELGEKVDGIGTRLDPIEERFKSETDAEATAAAEAERKAAETAATESETRLAGIEKSLKELGETIEKIGKDEPTKDEQRQALSVQLAEMQEKFDTLTAEKTELEERIKGLEEEADPPKGGTGEDEDPPKDEKPEEKAAGPGKDQPAERTQLRKAFFGPEHPAY